MGLKHIIASSIIALGLALPQVGVSPTSPGAIAQGGTGFYTAVFTPAAGTGITVGDTGSVREQVYKVTVDRTAIACAALTCDVTLATVGAKAKVVGVVADLTQVFACTATCTSTTLSFVVGKTAGGNEYLLSADADAATAVFGDAAGETGANLAASASQGGDIATWASSTAIKMRFTSGTGNLGNGTATNLSTGSITFYIAALVYG